jgi:hypothetical protein
MKRLFFSCVILLFSLNSVFSQVFSNKEVGQKNQSRKDSLKNSEYPYTLPMWGAKATNAGYSLPYSAGLSVQYFWGQGLS